MRFPFFLSKEPAPILLEVDGGRAVFRRSRQGGAKPEMEVRLPKRRADIGRQSPEVAFQELCDADIARAREVFSSLATAILPLLPETASDGKIRVQSAFEVSRGYRYANGIVLMREGTLRLEARLDADPPMPEARAVRQVFDTLIPQVERQLREAFQHILRGIEAKATR